MENCENNELINAAAPQEEEVAMAQEAEVAAPQEETAAPEQMNAPEADALAEAWGHASDERKVVSEPYSGAGVGRKESPFADSPYVMNHERPRTAPQHHYQCGSAYVPPIPPQNPPVKPKKAKKAKSGKIWKRIACAALALAMVAGACGITANVVNNRWETEVDVLLRDMQAMSGRLDDLQQQIAAARAEAAAANSASAMAAGGMTPSQVYARNVESVVLISCEVTGTNAFGQVSKGQSTGSGFVLTEDGYVVTNAHVVDGATVIKVSVPSGNTYEARLVGSDTTNDVALLKVEAEGLNPVVIGSSNDLIVGDQVVAIGNPLGDLTSTMTVGYVSAKDRDVTTDGTTINMIQTDAAINSGNSGGPLFNMKGEVVGITTAKYSGSSSSGASIESIGFAIPIDDVIGLLNDLRDYGYVTGAYLGVLVSNMDAQTAAYYRLPMGAYVQEVTRGYCAEAAGLQSGDIIIRLGDYEVENITDLTRALRKFKAGDTTTITVFRSGAEIALTITLDEKPASTETSDNESGNGKMPENGNYDEWHEYFFGGKG